MIKQLLQVLFYIYVDQRKMININWISAVGVSINKSHMICLFIKHMF